MTTHPRGTRGFTIGRAFGGRIVVQPSTLIMLALLAFLFSTNGGGQLDRRSFTLGLLLAVLLFASVLVHELAHAATAKGLGRDVHEVVLTLWGGHTSFDARNITPAVSGLTAIAGPAANLVVAGLGALALAFGGLDVTIIELVEGDITAYAIVNYLVVVNLILAAFNVLPGIPMDGGRVLEAIVWRVTGNRYRGVIVSAWVGRVIAVGVLLVAIGTPLVQGRTPDLFSVLWGFVIFMVLWPAASAALKGARALERRRDVSAFSLMVSATAVRYDVTVEQARELAHAAGAREVVVIATDGTPAGHFPVALTDAVPADEHATTGLQSVTMPLSRGAEVPPGLTDDALVETLRQWWGRTDVWVVRDNGAVVGVVHLADVMTALQ